MKHNTDYGRFSAARRTKFIAVSALSLALTGCIDSHSTDAAIKACADRGGAPTVGRWGEVTDCKFPPEKGAGVK